MRRARGAEIQIQSRSPGGHSQYKSVDSSSTEDEDEESKMLESLPEIPDPFHRPAIEEEEDIDTGSTKSFASTFDSAAQLEYAQLYAELERLERACSVVEGHGIPTGLLDGLDDVLALFDIDTAEPRLLPGQHVYICGLKSNPEFNGQKAVVKSLDEGSGRWVVQCNLGTDERKEFSLKPDNLQPIAKKQKDTDKDESRSYQDPLRVDPGDELSIEDNLDITSDKESGPNPTPSEASTDSFIRRLRSESSDAFDKDGSALRSWVARTIRAK